MYVSLMWNVSISSNKIINARQVIYCEYKALGFLYFKT